MAENTTGSWGVYGDDDWAFVRAGDVTIAGIRNGHIRELPIAIANLVAAAPSLLKAAQELRQAQRAYMANRGNDALGMIVGEKAAALDAAIDQATGKQLVTSGD